MKVLMVAAISQNGFLTRGSEDTVTNWTSANDKEFFSSILSKHKFFITGRRTFESNAIKPTPGILRLVQTEHPEKYTKLEIPGQLEFTNKSAREIVSTYQEKYDSCLLLGGGIVYKAFLRDGCVDEIFLTVEPVTFESGISLFENQDLNGFLAKFSRTSVASLNDSGTKLYHIIV